MKKTILVLILILGAILFGCSNNSVETESEDSISGTYFLHGTQIQLSYDFPWPSWGGEEVILSRDTSQVSFTVVVQKVEDRPDTLQIFGLEGVNAGRAVFPPECTELYIYCAYAKYTANKLEFDFSSPDGTYIGTGTLADKNLKINSHFEYRGTGVDYDLEGVRIEE